MLDAIAQTLAEQAAKPVPSATVNTPNAAVVALQQSVPVLKPTVSAPESIPSVSLPQATPAKSVQPTVAPSSSHPPHPETTTAKSAQPSNSTDQVNQSHSTVGTSPNPESEQARAAQRLLLKQRLADIIAKEKPLKEAKLRANLEATAIAFAQAGQFARARAVAQDAMLSSEVQANLLAQIDAIAAKRPLPKPTIVIKPLLAKPSSANVKAWVKATSGRVLPSVLPSVLPPSSQYSYIPPTPQQYVSYSLNGFGRAIGGIGVVVDANAPEFNGQNWSVAYGAGSRFNALLWNGLSFIFPLAAPAPITSGFGWRVHPITGDRRFHSGTDIGAPMGTPVLAAADGKVALADQLSGYGLAIILSHQNDTRETLYGHLSAMLVKPGQWVEKGTVIGRVGSTGLSTGPHLHFELRQKTPSGWQAIDPGVQLKFALARLVKAMKAG